MWRTALVCAALLFWSGCSHRNDERTTNALLDAAASALDRFFGNSENGIPDSALNAAKCVITMPSLPPGPGEVTALAVASCRNGSAWSSPIELTFSGRSTKTALAVLVLVMKDNGASELRSGEITLRKPARKAPLVSTSPLVTQFDLTPDYITYEVGATNVLAPGEAAGTFRMKQSSSPEEAEKRGGRKDASREAKKYEASLQSLINTIIPTGIVIHHTALIASDKLPTGEKDVDAYHQQRGFEIVCFGQIYHVAYHYLILADGTVQHGRPERCEGAHARGYNSYLGISVIGDFSSRDNPSGQKGSENATPKQLQALVELCRALRQKYKIPLQHVVRHSDIASTDCPGDRFPFAELLKHLQAEDDQAKGVPK